MRSRWHLAFTLATVLSVSGCDYWNNLVETKAVTRPTITLTIRDAWTNEPLPNTQCSETSRHLFLNPDGLGNILIPEATSGDYLFECAAAYYHNSKVNLRIEKKSTNLTIGMARLGGANWYPNEPARQVSIFLDSGNFRAPGKPSFVASPFDGLGIFHYRWKSSRYPNLNRESEGKYGTLRTFQFNLEPLVVDEVFDTLTVYVRAKLGSEPEYDVDSLQMPIVWTRNHKPSFTIQGSTVPNLQVGCIDSVYKIKFSAEDGDEDGQCYIEFSSADSSSSLGKKNYPSTCGAGQIYLPLLNPFKKFGDIEEDTTLKVTNDLKVTVWDDNGESNITSISFITTPHFIPKVSVQNVDTRAVHFSRGPAIEFRVKSSASRTFLSRLILNWGDGELDTLGFGYPPQDSEDKKYIHQYLNPGDFKVSAKIRDGCGIEREASLLENVHVKANDEPILSVTAIGYQLLDTIPSYQIQISASDRDLASGMDSLFIYINWGDGKPEPRIQVKTNDIGRNWTLSHVYTKPPLNATEYSLTVEVRDANAGIRDTLLLVKPYR
jgi:hypothetical protein